ncbi:hypothetical protein R0131_11280 [Clostridium sp. AL.422]|uniref:hypothetical protein n=1 Tax=Clostridium TaxID=1485 RepID=UPI00293DFECF|nr:MULTISPECIES: hypothetical protein [unclassified Clostridium]MDV4151424.1 hypothetical protein [Clostridium sp. AL.422]
MLKTAIGKNLNGVERDTSFTIANMMSLKKYLIFKIKKRKEIETAVGNYLIDKGVPIIDYYSHNNFL